MRIGVMTSRTARVCATVGGIGLAPILLVAGGPLLRCYLRYVYSDGGPGLVDKERGWVNPGWYAVHNVVVRCLIWPSEQVMARLDRRRPTWHRQDGG